MKKKVFMAMSGGVDSTVSAALLKRAGFDVIGVHMKCWNAELSRECTATDDEHSARLAAAHLKIPFYVWNFVDEYKKRVVDYMLEGYEKGFTPNPDIMCNKEIKFGLFYERAMKLGADFVATGHYARIESGKLFEGRDPEKDQSYFLSFIAPEVLEHTLFPIGNYHKTEVRKLAKKFKLPNAERKDSQGICFVGKVDIGNFLREYIEPKKGDIVDSKGIKIGEHDGASYYTIGQRKGLGLAGGPWFVVNKDVKANTVTVSKNEDDIALENTVVKQVQWLEEPKDLDLRVKIRYRQKSVPVHLKKQADGAYSLQFETPQRAITPGQFAAFYQDEQLLGGGVIQ